MDSMVLLNSSPRPYGILKRPSPVLTASSQDVTELTSDLDSPFSIRAAAVSDSSGAPSRNQTTVLESSRRFISADGLVYRYPFATRTPDPGTSPGVRQGRGFQGSSKV